MSTCHCQCLWFIRLSKGLYFIRFGCTFTIDLHVNQYLQPLISIFIYWCVHKKFPESHNCHWKLCVVTYWSSGQYQKREPWNSLCSFCLNISKNKGYYSKASILKFLACNWFCSLTIGHWGQLKCIELMTCTMQFIGSDIKLSTDSVSKVSTSASVTSIHSKKLSNQFSELEVDVSTWQAQSFLKLCQWTVSKVRLDSVQQYQLLLCL